MIIQKENPIIDKINQSANYYPKYLIIGLANKNGTINRIVKTSKIFGNYNWGLQGGDPFSDLSTKGNDIEIEFYTGGTTRFIYTSTFKYELNIWFLTQFSIVEFEWDTPELQHIKEYNFTTNILTSYDFLNSEEVNKSSSKINPRKKIYLTDIDMSMGIDEIQ